MEHVRDDDIHAYTPVLAAATPRFMVKQLGNDPDTVRDESEPDVLDPVRLNCTRSGQLMTDRPHAKHIFDLNLERYRELSAAGAPSLGEQRSWLRRQVANNRVKPTGFHPRWQPARADADASVIGRRVFWDNEPDLHGAGILLTPSTPDFDRVVIAVLDDGTSDLDGRRDWVRDELSDGAAVFAVDLRGMGIVASTPINREPANTRHGTGYTLLSR